MLLGQRPEGTVTREAVHMGVKEMGCKQGTGAHTKKINKKKKYIKKNLKKNKLFEKKIFFW